MINSIQCKCKIIVVVLVVVLFTSCRQFDGKITENDNSSVILTNTSKNLKLKFTIKTTIETQSRSPNSAIGFQELEPGEEKALGKSVAFLGEKYYNKQLYDTIKEYTHFDQIIKPTSSSIKISKELDKFQNKKYVYTKEYVKTYTKNNIKYNPSGTGDEIFPFWGSDWKKIDSLKIKNGLIITYLMPSNLVSDTTRPKKQQKVLYHYDIVGQRVIN